MLGNPRFSRRPPPTRALDHEFRSPRIFRGGGQVCSYRVTRPFARLTFDRDVACLELRSAGFRTRWADRSPVWILRSEVSEIVRTPGSLLSRGVMFAGDPDLFAGVVFWTKDRSALLAALAAEGWPIEPEP